MMCWTCEWGFSKAVQEIYDRAVEVAGEGAVEYGPAHVVWGDANLSAETVQRNLDHLDEYRRDLTDEQMEAIRRSLVELLALPVDVRNPEPDGVPDDADYSKYPPRAGVEMASGAKA